MPECKTCQSYVETRYPKLRNGVAGELSCANPNVTSEEFSAALGDDGCFYWQPNEREYKQVPHGWLHICRGVPKGATVGWHDETLSWWLDTDRALLPNVRFCAWCGLKLEDMPRGE